MHHHIEVGPPDSKGRREPKPQCANPPPGTTGANGVERCQSRPLEARIYAPREHMNLVTALSKPANKGFQHPLCAPIQPEALVNKRNFHGRGPQNEVRVLGAR